MGTLEPALGLLRASLVGRREKIVRAARGRVLDLGGNADLWSGRDDARTVLLLDGDGPRRSSRSARPMPDNVQTLDLPVEQLAQLGDRGPFDTIVSTVRLPLVAQIDAVLGAIVTLLAPGGRFRFLEPIYRAGLVGQLVRTGSAVWEEHTGLHLDRDVPRLVRAAGLVVTDLDRFRLPASSWNIRPLVDGVARHPTPVVP